MMARRALALLPALLLLAPVLAAPAVGSFHTTVGLTADREFVLVMRGTSFNEMSPHGPLLEAFVGERVRFTVVVPPAVGEPHTFHLHGHPWFVPEMGRMVDTFLLNAGDVHSFFVTAGSVDGEAGDWMYHCHFDDHTKQGMWGVFRVYPFATRATLEGATVRVALDRLGEPVVADDIRLALDGVPVAAHIVHEGGGAYALHAALPADASGELTVTATSALGESVARLALGDATPGLPLAGAPIAHAH